MSLLRQAACQALADYLSPLIQEQVPAMTGSVQVAWADFADSIVYPGVVVVPGKFRYMPYQEQEEDSSLSTQLLVSVGEMDGNVELRVYDNTQIGRRRLEQAVTEALLSNEGAPGVVNQTMQPVNVGGVAWVSGSLCSFQMDDAEWNEEMVFSSRRYSFMTLACQVPALYARTAYPINNLQLQFSAAVSEDLSTSGFVPGSDGPIEVLTVNPSGSATDFS